MVDATSVEVALRIRPLVTSELAKGCQDILEVFPAQNQIKIKNSDKAFSYNHVFDHKTSQSDFYEKCVKHLIENLFKGYNVTILAYGQTGSGKTHSMGTTYDGMGEMGVIPRAVTDIFNFVNDNFGYDFTVNVSFMELYQETLYDLLAKRPREQCSVEIREDNKGIVIPGLTEQSVSSAKEALECLMRGSLGRATASTNMNSQSSRSHAIYTININMQKKGDSNSSKTAKFHLVDLAGSERSKKTGATGQTFKEGVNINKGLLALGNVISALGDEKTQNNYIGYRDSNLTRLLKDSLGGNSITLMIACVSPADYNMEETISTLRYADRARKIKNKPIVNQDPKTAEINRLQKTIQQLRLELVGQGGPIICPAELELLKKEVYELKTKNRILNIKLASSLNDNATLYERVHIIETANEELTSKITQLKNDYNVTLTTLNESIDRNDVTAIKENVTKLETLQASLRDINTQQEKTLKDIRQHESDAYRPAHSDDSTSETEINEQQESHTAQQIALNTELQEVTRQLAMKERLAEHIVANNLYAVDQELIVECESKIATLEIEKDELMQQLKTVQSNGPSSKIAEQRRKRVQELESQIQELKKKVVEQARLIKLREKDEIKIKQLHNEIKTMKHTKVDLMKKMRSESDKFRTWKLQREREVQKLKDQDRKRQNQIVKMEIMHSRQQSVLKRKVEEAAAINKRLKDSLAKRKAANDMKNSGKIERIADWIQQELEIHSNTLDAQITLNSLLEDRATLHKQLDLWKNDEEMADSEEYRRLEDDIQLRSAQIQDLQQKVLDSQEESRAQTRWDNIQSMAEAKLALKTLFEAVSDIKKCTFSAENKVAELEHNIESLTRKNLDQLSSIKEMECEFSNSQREYEEKIAVLLRRVDVESHDDRQKQIWDIQQQTIENLQQKIEDLQNKMKAINDTVKLAEPAVARKKMKKEDRVTPPRVTVAEFLNENDFSFEDDVEDDPDWKKTPIGKKIQRMKLAGPGTKLNGNDTLKRNSEGGCNCKGNCSTRNCGCRKTTRNCSGSCKCTHNVCTNRTNNLNETETGKSMQDSDDSEDSFKLPVLHGLPVLKEQNKMPRRVVKRKHLNVPE